MGTVTITINTDNAAFDEPGEFARIVAQVAEAFEESRASSRITDVKFTRTIRDINGNTVATATFEGV